jgi:hypothetical protein
MGEAGVKVGEEGRLWRMESKTIASEFNQSPWIHRELFVNKSFQPYSNTHSIFQRCLDVQLTM